jgi:hypothetical protein
MQFFVDVSARAEADVERGQDTEAVSASGDPFNF